MTNLLFFCLLFFTVFTGVVIVLEKIRNKPIHETFNFTTKFLMTSMLLHCILILYDVILPLALLYGPSHLIMHRASANKRLKHFYIHFLPFIIMTLFYGVLVFSVKFGYSWGSSLAVYFPIHYVMVMISTFGYSIYVWTVNRDKAYNQAQMATVLQLATIATAIGMFIFILTLRNIGILNDETTGFNALHLVYGLMIVCVCVMVSYLITDSKTKKKSDLVTSTGLESARYDTVNIEEDLFKDYVSILAEVIDDRKLYLNSNLSLSMLSKESGIPKHHLSQLFSVYLNTTFYQYLAERRVQEAIFRIKEDDSLTLESLAYDCGFNSKSSFNKYFKDIVGVTPSEYRAYNKVTTIQ